MGDDCNISTSAMKVIGFWGMCAEEMRVRVRNGALERKERRIRG
jgi:hypothetical protein